MIFDSIHGALLKKIANSVAVSWAFKWNKQIQTIEMHMFSTCIYNAFCYTVQPYFMWIVACFAKRFFEVQVAIRHWYKKVEWSYDWIDTISNLKPFHCIYSSYLIAVSDLFVLFYSRKKKCIVTMAFCTKALLFIQFFFLTKIDSCKVAYKYNCCNNHFKYRIFPRGL